jgi:hypothetical protein
VKTTSRLVVAMAVALALAVPAIAAAAIPAVFTTGDYPGSTSQKNGQGKHRKFSLHADVATQQITNLKFNEAGKCTDDGGTRGSQGPLSAPVAQDGTFSINESSPSGATTVKLAGKIGGASASGTLKVTSRFDSAGNPTKGGSIRCTTGTVKWSAKTAG